MAEGHSARAGGGVVAGPGSVCVLRSIDGGSGFHGFTLLASLEHKSWN